MTEIKTIDVKTLHTWLTTDDVLIIDVREVSEFKEVRIPNAINIPLSTLSSKIKNIDGYDTKKLVLHCKAGIRSMMGCVALEKQGVNRVLWNLEGGIDEWIKSGFTVLT